MEMFLVFIGVIATTAGVMTLVAPQILDKMGKFLSQFYYTDALILAKRVFFGTISLAVGIVLIFLYFVY
ncbi:MAG: hypothetical protein ACE5D8_08175 [Fidelibacterota bacterium]